MKKGKSAKVQTGEKSIWAEKDFSETLGDKDLKLRLKTFHKGHDEDMNYFCKNCAATISAHNKDWHAGLCDNCFGKL
ncbi:MAG: hypothetical protein AABX01_02905 [Candidatus Micrarchaeota archaeon]